MARGSKAKKSLHKASKRASQLLELGGLVPGESTAELEAFRGILPENEFLLLQQTGAYNDVHLSADSLDEVIAVHEIYDTDPKVVESPVPIYSRETAMPPDELALDLSYLATELQPAETRRVLSDVMWRLLNGDTMSYLDLSDTVANSVGPSLARNAAVYVDAHFGLSTVLFLRVYRILRHVKVSYEISLCLARLDALLAACETFENF